MITQMINNHLNTLPYLLLIEMTQNVGQKY